MIIAVHNEALNVQTVAEEALAALVGLPPFEIIFVDDGSTDETAEIVARACRQHRGLRLLRHDRRCGKSAALHTGVAAARGRWVATMDGDGQNNPADIPRMLTLAWNAAGPAPLIAGVRRKRQDTLSRRVATRIANRLRRSVLADDCPDTGCGLKAFRREDFLRLPTFEGMHRFLPALFQLHGQPLACVPVDHRPRLNGRSKYTNLGRAMVGICDLLGVIWLRARTRVPRAVTEI